LNGLPAPAPTPEFLPSATPAQGGAVPAGAGRPLSAPDTSYALAMELRPSHDRLYAMLRVEYSNVTGNTLFELPFHLHPNAYQSASAPGGGEASNSYSGGFDKGDVIISSVSLNGELAYFKVSEDGMLLTVPFVKELLPGERAEAAIEFVVDIPTRNGRFGRTELGYQLGNFLPILAVYQDGKWMTDGYAPIGDPYYSEVADYRVAFTYPAEYSLASTGTVTGTEKNGALTTSYVAAKDVREFACMLGRSMQQAKEAREDVAIYSYALSGGSAERGAALAKNVLETLSPLLGNYPYSTLTVAQADMAYAGMEYPNLLMVQRELYLPGRELELELTIAHEIIHQWFYGLIGSDQFNAPWLDESLTSYLSLVYFERTGNVAAYGALCSRYLVERAALGGQIDGALPSYSTEDAYVNSAYWRGAAMFAALREKIGDEAFFNGLRAYIEDNAYGVATKAELIGAFERAANEPLAEWFDERLAPPPGAGAADAA
ncbi:MAG TPA: M1 family metallopeptidase, partial [Feifaniaceae bacterium]|nr:M1 family metallopeptidase [Feifaniaceae bacterium]